jgi:hypothetical protein
MEAPIKHPKTAAMFTALLAALDISASKLAKAISQPGEDYSQQVISNYVSGKFKPGQEVLAAIARRYPAINANWLLTGEGEIFPGGRYNEKAADQLPPQVPSELKPVQAPPLPGSPTPEQWRENMRVVAESAELREVKSERDNLRKTNEQLLAIIRNFTGGGAATDSAAVGKYEASLEAADLRETVDEIVEAYPYDYRIVAVRPIGFQASHLRIA